MKTKQTGFTLIELVVVIVLLGIVGAVATARFQNLANDARVATANGIVAEIQSGSAINYAGSVLNTTGFTLVVAGAACATVVPALLQGGLAAIWTVGGGNIAGCANPGDTTTTCTFVDNPATITPIAISLLCT